MTGGDPAPLSRAARPMPLIVPEPILDGREKRRQGERGVGRGRQIHGDQRRPETLLSAQLRARITRGRLPLRGCSR